MSFRESVKKNFFLMSPVTLKIVIVGGFPGGTVVKNLPANAGDKGLSPGLGGSHMPRNS